MQKVERMHKNVSHWPHSLFITIQSTYFHWPTSSPMPCECSRSIFNDLRHPTYSITGSSSHNRWILPHQKRQYHNQRTRSRHAIHSKLQYVVVVSEHVHMPSRTLYFVRNCHFSFQDFHQKFATPRTIVFAMPIIEYCHVKYQHFFIHYPMTQGCSGLYWSLLKQLHFSQFQCRKLKECTKMSVIDLILY